MKKIISLILSMAVMMSMVSFAGYAATETNLVTNGDFTDWGFLNIQTSPAGWSKWSTATIAKDNAHSLYKDEPGVKVTDSSTSTGGGITSKKFNVTPGKQYKLVVMGYIHEGTVGAMIRFFDSAGTQISGDIGTKVSKAGEWNKINISGIAPAGAATAYVLLYSDSSVVSSVTWGQAFAYEYGFQAPSQVAPVDSTIVAPNGNKLKYNTYDDKGNTLSDFSYAGFYAGKYEIPDSEYLSEGKYVELTPNTYTEAEIADGTAATTDTARINTAILNMSKSVTSKQMGVVKLKAGTYYVANTSILLKDNVVLSGEGQGPTGTILYAPGERPKTYNEDGSVKSTSNFIVIRGYKNTTAFKTGTSVNISDDYVKSGSKIFSVEDASGFKVGDLIRISHLSSEAWAASIGMTNIKNLDNVDTSWGAGDADMHMERTITEINGNQITVDFPFFVHLDNTIVQSTVCTINDSTRLVNAGVENLRIESDFNPNVVGGGGFTDEDHANYGVFFQYAKNCYVQDVTFKHIMHSAVHFQYYAKQITVRNCTSIEPVSLVEGSRRYTFACSRYTQQILINGCYSHEGRHDYETSYTATGPIAFVDNVADASSTASETHGTWSTGVLYDNLLHIGNGTGGFIATANRGIYGSTTSQGWSGAGVVIWNSLASTIIAHDVTGDYQNFMVGTWGNYTDSLASSMKSSNTSSYKSIYRKTGQSTGNSTNFATSSGTSFVGDSYKESATTPVEPRSLYKAQLSERITGNFKNVKPNAPTIVSPMPDDFVKGNTLIINGLYQKGASKVYLYIDNVQHEATLNTSNNTFSFETTLANGTHKIYTTQVINGVEGNKSADRFVIMNSIGSNSAELSSNYAISTLTPLSNDTRMSYDEYIESLIVDPLPETIENAITGYEGTASAENPITVKNQYGVTQEITSNYKAMATKVPEIRGYTVKKYGMTVTRDLKKTDVENAPANAEGKTDLTNDGGYGILFHHIVEGKTYYITPYVIYNEKSNGKDHTVYGETQTVKMGK